MSDQEQVSESIPCPVCGLEKNVSARLRVPRDQLASRLNLPDRRSKWVVCTGCGMVFQSPRPKQSIVDQLYLDGAYHQERGGVPEHYIRYSERRSVPALNWFLNHVHLSKGRAFDIGCGVGGALVHLRGLGFEVAGIEPDPLLSEVARTRYGLDVATGYFKSDSTLKNVDLVFSCHVWEHLQDPVEVARDAHKLLVERGGYLFIVVPTYYKSRTNAWKCFNSNHTNMFTHVSLSNVLRRSGFEIVTHTYRSDADSELWLIARARTSPIGDQIIGEDLFQVQRRIMFASLKAPLGLPARMGKHIRTFVRDPRDFVDRSRRAVWQKLSHFKVS